MAGAKLRGKTLGLVIGVVGAVGFVLQGYDQAVANGLLTLGSFIAVFPQIDTVNTKGAQQAHNSTIQGWFFNTKSHSSSNSRQVRQSLSMKSGALLAL